MTLMPYGFFDFGQVWQRTRFPGLDATQSAASSGGGFRLSVGRQFSGFVEFATPLTKIIGQENNRRGRVYAGLSIQ
jgi:hemolysin activation/secretion protein